MARTNSLLDMPVQTGPGPKLENKANCSLFANARIGVALSVLPYRSQSASEVKNRFEQPSFYRDQDDMEHHLENLLRVWADAGLTVERHDREFIIIGMDPPDWWAEWCKHHRHTLVRILPDLSAAEPEIERQPLPEDRMRGYNMLSLG